MCGIKKEDKEGNKNEIKMVAEREEEKVLFPLLFVEEVLAYFWEMKIITIHKVFCQCYNVAMILCELCKKL